MPKWKTRLGNLRLNPPRFFAVMFRVRRFEILKAAWLLAAKSEDNTVYPMQKSLIYQLRYIYQTTAAKLLEKVQQRAHLPWSQRTVSASLDWRIISCRSARMSCEFLPWTLLHVTYIVIWIESYYKILPDLYRYYIIIYIHIQLNILYPSNYSMSFHVYIYIHITMVYIFICICICITYIYTAKARYLWSIGGCEPLLWLNQVVAKDIGGCQKHRCNDSSSPKSLQDWC